MWPELKECIHNIEPHPFKLFVTMVEKHPDIWDDILIDFPNAHIEVVENRGYDIGPFVHIINQVNLDDYSYVVKLHTKRDIPSKTDTINDLLLHGPIWRDKLLSPFKNKEIFAKYISAFDTNKTIGMQAHYTLMVRNDRDEDFSTLKKIKIFMRKYAQKSISYSFIAGTMFIARANIFKRIQQFHLSLSDFQTPAKREGELAHVMERIMGYIVYRSGYVCFDGNTSDELQNKFQKSLPKIKQNKPLLQYFYQKKITKSGKIIVKVCRIPIFIRKVK